MYLFTRRIRCLPATFTPSTPSSTKQISLILTALELSTHRSISLILDLSSKWSTASSYHPPSVAPWDFCPFSSKPRTQTSSCCCWIHHKSRCWYRHDVRLIPVRSKSNIKLHTHPCTKSPHQDTIFSPWKAESFTQPFATSSRDQRDRSRQHWGWCYRHWIVSFSAHCLIRSLSSWIAKL